MLTQSDLKAIEKLFDSKLDSRLSPIEKRVDSFERSVNRRFRSIDRKLDIIINYFDHQDRDLRKRVSRIETHLHLAPLNS